MNKPAYPHPPIAREGWPFAGGMLALALLATLVWGFAAAWFLWLIAGLALLCLRDPARLAPDAPGAVLAPADGRVIGIEPARDEFSERDALRISLLVGPFVSPACRAPVGGTLAGLAHEPGGYGDTRRARAMLENDRTALLIDGVQGHRITCVLVAGPLARRVACQVREGDALARGQRCGYTPLGSRVDVYLPRQARPRVAVGDKVTATSTVLADLPLIESQS
ncbi:phosphatidylserine decarboxylase [Orrella sp. JC864]|uniref:phosphatidylserine decarboxylase n=1 Tax=Orrella sp. JC864 TaxID=3120298 RepID=UPI00300A6013